MNSGSSGPASGRSSGTSSASRSAAASSRSAGQELLGSTTFAQLDLPFCLASTSSAADSPARTSAAQERARALLVSARACGVSSLASSASLSPNGSSLRTSQAEPVDGSTPLCATWESAAMRAYRSRCRQAMSALRTAEDASSLLPTLTLCGNYNRQGAIPTSGDGLVTAMRTLPTLTACSYGANHGGQNPGPARPSLETMARRGTLPTLCSRDEKGPGPAHTMAGSDLPQALGVYLNPEWCLWFMGFPAGWLDVDDAPAFVRSATPSSRSAQRSSDG